MKKYLLPLFILLAVSCTPAADFEKYEELPEETWKRSNVIELIADIPADGLYKISLCLRHTTDYEMSNLWCFISTRSHAPKQLEDTLNLKLAEPDGHWIGKGRAIRTIEQPLHKSPFTFPKGKVIFRIQQGMRVEEIKGVKNIGIRIEKINKK
ncbi:MAG: gliding motility lipoprotein GldH [Odoribacter sp.]